MLELGIPQVQAQFTQILNQAALIVDRKAHHKKAVILPYDEYMNLITHILKSDKGGFNKFVGVLDKDFKTNDVKYNEIIS